MPRLYAVCAINQEALVPCAICDAVLLHEDFRAASYSFVYSVPLFGGLIRFYARDCSSCWYYVI